MKNCKRKLVFLVVVLFVISMVPLALADEGGKININTATVEELANLNGIGPKYAERIVQYREANGPFVKVEDILMVKGIGAKILELNKNVITVK
ncbi:MAG: ComEA family DNA-binding protein [Deltaproteobacteria bacterium]|nr:ComEA family DNA-binding protein [Deltaproteobacteria bacterium]MBW2648778.1 ComEA family DNA-binding protein [Deltaproteobacteria bacterium]